MWFALNDDRPLFAFGGIWTEFKGHRGTTKSKPITAPRYQMGRQPRAAWHGSVPKPPSPTRGGTVHAAGLAHLGSFSGFGALSDQPYEDERSDLDQDRGPQGYDDKNGVGWR